MGPAGFQPAESAAAVYDRCYQGAASSKPPTLIKTGGLETAAPLVFRRMPEEASKMLDAPVCFASAIDRVTDITLSPA